MIKMGKTIAIANQKGGVGKTTTSVNLGASLATLDKKTLIIDADPQANATSGVGIPIRGLEQHLYHSLTGEVPLQDLILPTKCQGLYIVPSSVELVGAELELVEREKRHLCLKLAMQKINQEYDYILIDCSPSLGIITLNALCAADSVIVPVQCEYYALEGLSKLLSTILSIQKKMNPSLSIEGILMTLYDARLKLSNSVVEEVEKFFSEIRFQTIIPRNVNLAESASFGNPAILIDVESNGAKAYLNLALEIIDKNKASLASQ